MIERGDKVRIIDGPYRGFEGLVDDAPVKGARIRVIVPVHGRPTELEFTHAEVRPL
ncbi:MAG: KOW motif-containing protein [Candidatus Rokubacteria bacterium]|nr:KOW motif-containing protein [Candidatus Rokubacteria bacterium]